MISGKLRQQLKQCVFIGIFLTFTNNLQAAEVTWVIQNGEFADNGRILGMFVFDASTQTLSDWSISVSGGNTDRFPEIVYTPQNSTVNRFNISNPEDSIQFALTDDSNRQLRMTPSAPLTDDGGVVPLNLNTARGQSGGVECFNCAPVRLITGGELASTVLAPPPVSPPKPEGLSGLWFDPDKDGEGYNVVNTANGMVVYFYGYSAAGERLWLLSDLHSETIEYGKEITIDIYEFKGGLFLLPLDSQTARSLWGTLTVNYISCEKATFSLSGVDGDKTSNAVKLSGIINTDC